MPVTKTEYIAAFDDDVELEPPGHILNSNDVDFHPNTLVGLRYYMCIDPGATVLSASLTFTADEADDLATNAVIWSELTEDAAPFPAADPSTRTLTSASVTWTNIQPWLEGDVDTSPDLAVLLNEVLTNTPWNGCGHLVFVIQGDGDREAVSYDKDPTKSPLLTVTYQP